MSELKDYPRLLNGTPEDMRDVLYEIIRTRSQDQAAFDQIKAKYIAGRKVTRTPSASNDVLTTDRLGDLSADENYIYILIDDSGLAWRRAALGSW